MSEFKQRNISNTNRRQHVQRLTVYNRNLRNLGLMDTDSVGGSDRSESSRRARQKTSSSKRSSVGARMSKGGDGCSGSSTTEKQEHPGSRSPVKKPMSFGPPIPDDVLDDVCFRFLINIPDDQKSTAVRICFQIELAHWFYIDFYCKGNNSVVKCPSVNLRDFFGQIFCHCDFLVQYADSVDKVMEEWRVYKSGVPTYGAILLDSSMNYVLLVQGYFARNSWGFPKGKVNQEEEEMSCAAREVWEEVGFDISDKICKTRLIQNFMNDTLTRLYIIRDVPIDFPFAPNTRNEIGKIQWFSIWDLPKDRNDVASCDRIGMNPNCFYTVVPFVRDLQAYVTRHHNMRNKPKHKPTDAVNIGARSSSAFSPVQPQQKNDALAPALSPLFAYARNRTGTNFPVVSQHSSQQTSPNSAFFKPLTTSAHQVSYTGTAFVQMLSSGGGASCTSIEERVKMNEVRRPVPSVPKAAVPVLGRPVYDAFRDETKEKTVSASIVEAESKDWVVDPLYHIAPDVKVPNVGQSDGNKSKKNTEYGSWPQHLASKTENSPVPEIPHEEDVKNYVKEMSSCLEIANIAKTTATTTTAATTTMTITTISKDVNTPIVNLCEAWQNFKQSLLPFFLEMQKHISHISIRCGACFFYDQAMRKTLGRGAAVPKVESEEVEKVKVIYRKIMSV